MDIVPASGVMATSGELAAFAARRPVMKLVTPGPFYPIQTPGLPVTL